MSLFSKGVVLGSEILEVIKEVKVKGFVWEGEARGRGGRVDGGRSLFLGYIVLVIF